MGTPLAVTRPGQATLHITLTTTLTSDDENRISPALLKTIASILDLLPVAYRIRIDTADARTYQVIGPSLATKRAAGGDLRIKPVSPGPVENEDDDDGQFFDETVS